MVSLNIKDIELINKLKELVEKDYNLDEINVGDMYDGNEIITIRLKRKEVEE